jgi:hypothetical protein
MSGGKFDVKVCQGLDALHEPPPTTDEIESWLRQQWGTLTPNFVVALSVEIKSPEAFKKTTKWL